MEPVPGPFAQTPRLELAALRPERRVLIVDDDPDAYDCLVAVAGSPAQ